MQHEAIIVEVARFHFTVACTALARMSGTYFGWSNRIILPARAAKYFGEGQEPGKPDDYEAACAAMAAKAKHKPEELAAVLFDHLSAVVDDQDECIEIVSTFRSPPTPRDDVVPETQAWAIAFGPDRVKFEAPRSTDRSRRSTRRIG